MKSLWKPQDAKKSGKSLLAQRIYTSRLLGASHDLVLHGGGNTSVKARVKDFYGKMKDEDKNLLPLTPVYFLAAKQG